MCVCHTQLPFLCSPWYVFPGSSETRLYLFTQLSHSSYLSNAPCSSISLRLSDSPQFSHSFPSISWQHLTPHMTHPPSLSRGEPTLPPSLLLHSHLSILLHRWRAMWQASSFAHYYTCHTQGEAGTRERVETCWHGVVLSTTSGEHLVHSTLHVFLSFLI